MFTWFGNLRLRWKIFSGPAFLILVLIGFGAHALYTQRANQIAVDALMTGPVRQAEAVADFSATAWASEVHLYRLMALAANETDQEKIKALADRASAALSDVVAKFQDLEGLKFENPKAIENIGKLKTSVADYVKRARGVIDMADSDSGTALMLMQGAARSFTAIEDLTRDLTAISKDVRDQRTAVYNAELQQQEDALIGIMLGALAVSFITSLLVSRGIARPVVAIAGAIEHMAQGNFDMALPGLGRKDEIGDIATAVEHLKRKAAEKAQREALARAEEDRKTAEQTQREAAQRIAKQAEQEREMAAERDAAMAQLSGEFEHAVGSIVEAAVHGDFSQRVAVEGKSGLVLNVGISINKLCENVSKALDDLAAMLGALAEGDLTQRINGDYQGCFATLKGNANTTAERVGTIIAEIKCAGQEVASAAAEISASSSDLSQRTEEQATSLEQTSASMEEMSVTVKKNADHAKLASQFASETQAVADRSGDVVAQAVQAMSRIDEFVAQDRRHHHRDRRNRAPDQFAGAQRGGGSGASR